ncbi:MAG TPA: hypothetical protein VFS39_06090 [Nitrospira sp.]|nr:hypothetical protein [Nitrospira sp.]
MTLVRTWLVAALCVGLAAGTACSRPPQNSLSQNTGEAGSTIPKARPPYYPNTAGNIVAPPGNPGGNPAGAPPIVGGTENQQGAWPEGR